MKGRVTPSEIADFEEKQKSYQNGFTDEKSRSFHVAVSNGDAPGTNSKYDEKEENKEEKKEDTPLVGFFEVFKFASIFDGFLMILGTLCAAIHGSAIPLMIVVFGEMIELFVNFGEYEYQVDLLVSLGLLASWGLSKSDVIENPSLLLPRQATIEANAALSWPVIQEAIDNDLLDVMRRYSLYFVAIGCGALVFGYGQVCFWMIASERQTHRMRKAFFRNVLRQNIGWFDTQESGQLNSRLSDDISKIHDGIGDKCGHFMQWFCGFIAGFIVGFVYGWKLTLVILAISPLLAAAAFMMSKLVALASGAELKAYAKAGAVAEEVLGGIRTVSAFGGQNKECSRYESNLLEARTIGIRKGLVNGVSMGVVWFVVFGAYGLGFWYGGKLTRDEPENYNIGDVMIVFFAVLMGAFSLGSAAPYIQSFSVARGAAYTVWELIERDPPIDSYSEEGLKLDSLQGNIEISGVDFRYPSRPDVQVLDGLSLSINRGQTVALVGSSGCGKSTVVQLIQRFYDPDNGRILIDGVDIKDLNLKWLRQHIGIVSQEPVLFGTTIAENIRYGRDGVTHEEIEAAAMKANAHDFISNLPDKYETLVGERGAQLSGGQKQRIAIARALVRDPQILLLDEATSALDTESEGVVQEALEKAAAGRTTIVIAHRLSTIKTADMIAGFKGGKVAEKGTHNELMGKQGIYQQLVNLQTSKTQDDIEAEQYEKVEPGKKKLKTQKSTVMSPQKSVSGKEDEKEDEEKKEEEKPEAGLFRILQLNRSEWWSILLGCFGALINGGLMPAFAVIFAQILGVFSEQDEDKQKREITMYSLMFVGLGFLSLITYFLQGYMFGRSGEHLTMTLRSMSFRALLRQEMAYFDDHDNTVGALTTRLSTDASQVQGAAGVRVGTVIMSLCSILAGMIISFIYSWKMTLVILGFVPLLIVSGALQMQMLNGAAGKNKEALEAAGKVAVESVENVRTVASLTREDAFCQKFKSELDGPYKAALKKAHIIGIAFSFSQAVMFYAYGAAFYFGAWLITQNELDYVDVFTAFSAVVFGAMGTGQASSFAPDAAKAQVSAEHIFKLLDRKPAIDSESDEGNQPSASSISGAVTFNDVQFHYPTRSDVKVLSGLNLTVSPGQTVALVGSSGCGKSTTVQLIERFYDAEGGQVFIDKYNLTDLNIQWLRARIGIVSQEPVLFDRSIADNIAYGDNSREVPMAEIIQAARNANIHEFISSLPDGYDTNVGEKGAQLSGGQKQRVAIARALVRNPQILLLDEATSALDTESEKVVQEALDKAREGRTSIVIAHRLSTIQNADKICVIRHGVVTEEGTHSELMKNQGFYYKLNMAQARKK